MTESLAPSRILTHKRALGRFSPRRASKTAEWRFRAERTREYLQRIGMPPTAYQSDLINELLTTEWAAVEADHRAREADLRAKAAKTTRERREAVLEAQEERRQASKSRDQFMRHNEALERSMQRQLPPVKPRPASYRQHVAERDGTLG